ncbi:MAG TPA: amidohydrolase [Terriglobales bacterium]|jgi:hippurate hydrolase
MKMLFVVAPLLLAFHVSAQNSTKPDAQSVFPEARALYLDLHQSPELSSHETQTAAKLAGKLRALGYDVTEHVGGTGIVAIMKNGAGPTVMLRTELDALPVEEKTGLQYASHVHTKDDAGHDVPVMHACGHDLHIASLYGTAEIMARSKDTWHGTLMLIGQPAEETITGAKAMIADNFLTRFPKPDVGVALHTSNELPSDEVGVASGYRYANADSLRVTVYGRGGHGSAPNTTIDPVVIAAKIVLGLQTIVSREIKPGEPAVITVGYMQAGTKNNIIPDTAQLGITVRSYKPEVKDHLLKAIERVVNGEAQAAGVEKMPLVEHYESTAAVYNDPKLAARLTKTLQSALGAEHVKTVDPIMGSEDYSVFIEHGIPSFYFGLGGADPQKWADAKAKGVNLPSNHSSLFAPDLDPALKTGIEAEVAVLRELLRSGGAATGAH